MGKTQSTPDSTKDSVQDNAIIIEFTGEHQVDIDTIAKNPHNVVHGKTITFYDSSIKKIIGGHIITDSNNNEFKFLNKKIMCITKSTGEVVWTNPDCKS